MENEDQLPHNDLRIIEAELLKVRSVVGGNSPAWGALDRLWDFVVLGPKEGK